MHPQAAPARIIFDYDFPGETPSHYRIELTESGQGRYQAPSAEGLLASDMAFHLSPTATASWFATARELHYFDGNFEARRKVAAIGSKTLRFDGPDGHGQATMNYTEDKRMAELIRNFQSIGFTLQIGQRFESDIRFHRIGLDDDMGTLQQNLKNRLASHPEIIAPILQRLVDDPEVMERLRREAAGILHSATAN
jgi:hypothetical protein